MSEYISLNIMRQLVLLLFCLCVKQPVIARHTVRQLELIIPANEGFLNAAITNIAGLLESKNRTDHIMDLISELTPALNKSIGMNEITHILQKILPEDIKNPPGNVFPNTIDFPFTHMWVLAGKKWEKFVNHTEQLKSILTAHGALDRARDVAKGYNEFVEWRTEVPFAIYDTKIEGIRNITQPIYDTRTQFIETRDEVLNALLRKQQISWEPIVNQSAAVGESLDKKINTLRNVSDILIFNKLSHSLYNLRTGLNKLHNNRMHLRHSTKLCLLVPECCNHPTHCAPYDFK